MSQTEIRPEFRFRTIGFNSIQLVSSIVTNGRGGIVIILSRCLCVCVSGRAAAVHMAATNPAANYSYASGRTMATGSNGCQHLILAASSVAEAAVFIKS